MRREGHLRYYDLETVIDIPPGVGAEARGKTKKEVTMSTRSWLRLGAVCGILSVVLEFGGFGLRASNSPIGLSIFPPKEQLANAIAQPTNTAAWVGFYLLALSVFLQFVFMVRLWVRLRGAEGDPPFLAAAALGAQGAWLGVVAVSLACQAAVQVRAGQGADVSTALALTDLTSTSYFLSWAPMALFLGTTAAVSLRTQALPRWLAWSAAGIALLLAVALLAPGSPLAQMPGELRALWMLAASIVLLRPGEETRPAVGAVPVASSASVG